MHGIVLLRRGAFVRHRGRAASTIDVNQVAFFSGTDTYRVSHPADRGDCGTVLVPSPRLLAELLAHTGSGEDPANPFPFSSGPCPSGVFWRHHILVRRLAAGAADSLEMEVTAAELAASALGAAAAARGGPLPRRSRTRADHAERAEGIRAYLAEHAAEQVTLDQVARAVYASPFHCARLFREQSGVPIHRYLMRLRLRSSLESLREGGEDLSTLALRLGFSSHGHFTDAFRREFGCPPSALRGRSSRNLEAGVVARPT
jgi:AraC family transcriptional regulator